MESFDFNSLSSEAQQQTFAFLGMPNNTSMPELAPEGLEAFPDLMMELPFFDNEALASFGDGDAGAAMPFGFTDEMPFQQLLQPPVQVDTQIGLHQSQVAQVTHVESRMESRFHCDWPLCKSQAQYDIHQLESHKMRVHIADVLATWPGKCSWPECPCKAFFKTSKRLEAHVFNIHITPLYCAVDGCTHRRPFERQADLDRHIASKHTERHKYKCSHPKCSKNFSRKDKFKTHQKDYHERFACQYSHCGQGFASDHSLSRHKMLDHGNGNECALGSCAYTSPSKFQWWNMHGQHLMDAHGCSEDTTRSIFNEHIYRGTWKMTIDDFPNGIPGFKDCEECKKKLKKAEEAKMDNDTNN